MAAEKTVAKGCRFRKAEIERLRNLLYNFPELKDEAGVLYQAALRGMLTFEVQATRPGGTMYGGMSEVELADALIKRLLPAIDFLYDGGHLPARYYRGLTAPTAVRSVEEKEVEAGVQELSESRQLLVIDEQAAEDVEGLGSDFME